MPASASFSPDTALTEIGTSCSDSSRFCAVTMISSSTAPWTSCWAFAAGAPRVVRARPVSKALPRTAVRVLDTMMFPSG